MFGYLTPEEVSKLTGVDLETIIKRCETGYYPKTIKQNDQWMISRSEVFDTSGMENVGPELLHYAMFSETDLSTSITILVDGIFFSGETISKRKYYSNVKESIIEPLKLDEEKAGYITFFNFYDDILKGLPVLKEKPEKHDFDEFFKQVGIHSLYLTNVSYQDNNGKNVMMRDKPLKFLLKDIKTYFIGRFNLDD